MMKRYLLLIILFLFTTLSSVVFAGWQVARPESAMPREPFFNTGVQPKHPFAPTRYTPIAAPAAFPDRPSKLTRAKPVYAVSICGSLKENLERIMGRYRWRVIWKAPYDYNFDGRVMGSSLPNVVQKLLKPFPLQAVMYLSNRTITVIPREKVGSR